MRILAALPLQPRARGRGKNPFTLDSKEPTGDYQAFIGGEVRYASLKKQMPEVAAKLFEKTEADSKARLESYKKLAGQE